MKKIIIIILLILSTIVTETDAQIIHLYPGWNLIGITVKNCYITGPYPTVPLIRGTIPIVISSFIDLFGPELESIKSEDSNGEHFYIPGGTSNNLTYLAGGYGYWVRMKTRYTIILRGERLDSNDQLYVYQGWNLIAYWGKPRTPARAFRQLGDKYEVARSYDRLGAHTYDPSIPKQYNNMPSLHPGIGLQLKMNYNSWLSYQ